MSRGIPGGMEYIRHQYQKPWLKVGVKIKCFGQEARVIGSDESGHVRVVYLNKPHRTVFVHPGDVERI